MLRLNVVLILFMATRCASQTVQDAKDLQTYLFTTNGYDKRVRPVSNLSEAIDVFFMLDLMSIMKVDEVQEVIHVTALLYITWNDTELQWDPTSYNGLEVLHLPQGDVWKPDMGLSNSQSGLAGFGYDSQRVKVHHNGSVIWTPFVVMDAVCSINIRYFPFDKQECPMKFIDASYTIDEILLYSYQKGISLYDYEPHPVWTVLDTDFDIQGGLTSRINFYITIQRKSMYVLTSVLFPLIMLIVLNISVFFTAHTGARCKYAITLALAFTVFLTLVEKRMPPTSDHISLFSIYLVIMIAMSMLITVLAAVMNRCFTFKVEKTKIPKVLIVCAKIGKFRCCRQKKLTKLENTKNPDEKPKTPMAFEDDSDVYTWKKVVEGLDIVLAIVFACVYALLTIILFSVAAAGD